MRDRLLQDRGFSLIEVMIVALVFSILAAIAVPHARGMIEAMRLGQVTRDVERELQSARLKAVSTNRRLRVRMNCPVAGQFRTVEFLGNLADTATGRCSDSAYPYPPADRDPVTLPNYDGPVRLLPQGVTLADGGFEFRPDGTAWALSSTATVSPIPAGGSSWTLTYKSRTKAINVNSIGKIAIQ